MELRTLGKSGLRVSVVGLGTNNFGMPLDDQGSAKILYHALDQGVNFIDASDSYGKPRGACEEILGRIMGDKRKDIILATKFGLPMDDAGTKRGSSRRYIMSAVEASLTRLQTDYIDLYQSHRWDPATPLEETLRALDDLVRDGKVRYLGCSRFTGVQVVESQSISRTEGFERFIACQDEYSLLNRDIDRELVPVMQSYGIGLLPFMPLLRGLLTGKYKRNQPMPEGRLVANKEDAKRYLTDANFDKVEKLEAFAKAHGHTLLELALSWLVCKPYMSSLIASVSTIEQFDSNLKASSWKLSAEEMAEVDKITQ